MEQTLTNHLAEPSQEASCTPAAMASSSRASSSASLDVESKADAFHPEKLSGNEELGPSLENKSENMDLDSPGLATTDLVSTSPRDLNIDSSSPSSDPVKNTSSIEPMQSCSLEENCSSSMPDSKSSATICDSSIPANGSCVLVDESEVPKEVSKVGSGTTRLKPIFARGFLDRPAPKKAANCNGKAVGVDAAASGTTSSSSPFDCNGMSSYCENGAKDLEQNGISF